ncbi:hypothetical protein D046_1717B, partial [Vibrio parahaemolyticus V-223/04]
SSLFINTGQDTSISITKYKIIVYFDTLRFKHKFLIL